MSMMSAADIRNALAFLDSHLKDSADRAELTRWGEQLDSIERDARLPLDCAVALLGESGAGKSSLLNALLGIDLLPHDAGSAVTAAVTEIAAGSSGFEIVAEIESRDEFVARFAKICLRLREAFTCGDGAEPMGIDESDASVARSVTGMDIADLVRHSVPGQEAKHLVPEVGTALECGPRLCWTYADGEIEAAQSRCRECLSSRKHLWPLVRRVVIRGPFPLLQSGVRLVDVPGLNDPDPVRNAVAQKALQGAQLVWLVLNAKRAMTGSIMQFLTDSRLLTRLEMEGRLGSLIAVATHSDQFDEQGLADAFGLTDDVSLDELLTRHRERVFSEVQRALLRAWGETVQRADGHVSPESVESGRARLHGVPFFSVSSTEYLAMRRVIRARKGPSLEREDQTGIPELVRWMQTEFVDKERQVHSEQIARRTKQLREAIRSTLGHRGDIKRRLARLRTAEKGGLKGFQDRAQTFLSESLQAHSVQATKEVETQAEKVSDAIRAGVDAADREMRTRIPERLSGIHWATLRAIVRRDGVFCGSTQQWDLPAEIAAGVSQRVVFRWAELFEYSTKRFLEGVVSKSADLSSQHAHFLISLIVESVADELPGLERLKQPTQQVELELDLIDADIAERLHVARMSFERDLVNNLRHRLQPAFERASEERGQGMKQRMVDGIVRHIAGIAPELLPALSRDLDEKVVEVKGILKSQVSRAHESVRRIAKIESHNVEVALFQRTPEELLGSADVIAQGMGMLESR